MRKSLLTLLIKSMVFIAVGGYIGYIIENKDDFNSTFQQSITELISRFGPWLLIPLLLFLANWAVEAMKWQYLVRQLEKMSMFKAFRSILTGVSIGLATPFSLGDYAGRILQLSNPDRAKAIGAVFVSRISQLYITLLWGSLSLVYFFSIIKDSDSFLNLLLFFFVLLSHLLFAVLLFFHKKILSGFRKNFLLSKVYPYLEIISQYSIRELLYVICLSFFRYFIFAFQFVMILYFFDITHNLLLLVIGVNFIFLVKSIVPTFFDLGVRESAAVYFFSSVGCASDKVIYASLSLWAINILLPAIIGLFLIFRLKIFPNS